MLLILQAFPFWREGFVYCSLFSQKGHHLKCDAKADLFISKYGRPICLKDSPPGIKVCILLADWPLMPSFIKRDLTSWPNLWGQYDRPVGLQTTHHVWFIHHWRWTEGGGGLDLILLSLNPENTMCSPNADTMLMLRCRWWWANIKSHWVACLLSRSYVVTSGIDIH